MLGFFVIVQKENKVIQGSPVKIKDEGKWIHKSLTSGKVEARVQTLSKFDQDKCFQEDEKYIVILEGVVLNSEELQRKYNCSTMFELCTAMYEKEGDAFFDVFRGSFSGFLYEKGKDKTLVFTNHMGDSPVYYHEGRDEFLFANNIKAIGDYLQKQERLYRLSKEGAYSLLSYAFMYHDYTLIDDVYRLLPGHYGVVENGAWEKTPYHEFFLEQKEPSSIEAAIEEMDFLFCRALQLQLDKNKQYGYKNYVTLSAGMDTRIVNYVLKKLSDETMYNITYSETGQYDEKVPALIANELKNHWIFTNLDNGLSLKNIEGCTEISEGMYYYGWTAFMEDFMGLVDQESMGIIHTGVSGNDVASTLQGENIHATEYTLGDSAYSKILIPKLASQLKEQVAYKNYEQGMYLLTNLNSVCFVYGNMFSHHCAALSPFNDPDVAKFGLSLPIKMRLAHNFYYKWVAKCYPEAIKYPHNGTKIPRYGAKEIHIKGKDLALERIPSMIIKKIQTKTNPRYHMNPFDHWYHTNEDLREHLDGYLRENLDVIRDGELRQDTLELYEKGNTIEKVQSLSLIAAVKRLSL